jgi:hypothetical protein
VHTTNPASRPSPQHGAAQPAAHRWLWLAVPAGILVIVLWPLHALAIAMLATTALMAVSIYAVFTEHGAVPRRLRPRLDRLVPIWAGAALAAGVVMTMLWPTTVTPIAFGLLVLACIGWLLSEWLLGHHEPRRTERDHLS